MKFISKEDALLGGLTLILQTIFLFFRDNYLIGICFFVFVVLNILSIMRLIKKIKFLEQMNNRFYRLSAFLRPLGWFFYIEVSMLLFLIVFMPLIGLSEENIFVMKVLIVLYSPIVFFVIVLIGLIRMIFAKPPVPSANTEVENTDGEIIWRSGGR